jgi:hypothetical protein
MLPMANTPILQATKNQQLKRSKTPHLPKIDNTLTVNTFRRFKTIKFPVVMNIIVLCLIINAVAHHIIENSITYINALIINQIASTLSLLSRQITALVQIQI